MQPLKTLVVCETHTILYQYPNPEDKFRIKRIFDCYRDGEFFDTDLKDHNIHLKSLFIGDSKPYWRTHLYNDYKANRPKRSLAFPRALQINGYEDSIYIENFEADDIAGLIWRLWPTLKQQFDLLIFVTIDSDWLQFLTEPSIIWANQKSYLPFYRSCHNLQDWLIKHRSAKTTTKKNKLILDQSYALHDPNDLDYFANVLRDYKWLAGDKADNIPPNMERYLTDLLNSPPEPYGEILDHVKHVIHDQLNGQEFKPALYSTQYQEDCIIDDHAMVPLLDLKQFKACTEASKV